MKVAVLVGIIIFTFHNLKGKDDLKVIFLRLCRCYYSQSNSNQHVLNAAYVPNTVLFHGLSCLILTAAPSGECGCLVKVTEVSGPRSHRT